MAVRAEGHLVNRVGEPCERIAERLGPGGIGDVPEAHGPVCVRRGEQPVVGLNATANTL